MAEDLISKYIFKAEGINEIKAQAAQLGGYLQTQGSKAGTSFSTQFKKTLSPESFGKMAGTVAAGAVAAVPLAMAAGLAHATSVAAGFEQSMANVASVTGGGAEAMEALSAAAREAGASSIYTASQAGQAQYFLASAGYNTEQITAALGSTLNLAAAGQMDLARASEITTGTLASFGATAEEADRYTNVLAATAAKSNTSIEQIGIAMEYVGPVAGSLGMSIEDTSAALGLLANANLKGSMGGTALRGVLTDLMTTTDEGQAILESYGLAMEDLDPSTHSFMDILTQLEGAQMSSADVMAIWGQRAGPGMLAMLQQGTGVLAQLNEDITGTSKASEMAATQTETFQGQMKMLGSAIEEAEISIGNALLPSLTEAVTGFTEGVRWATEWGSTVSGAFEGLTGKATDWKMFFPGVELYEGLEKLDNKVGEVLSGGTETRGLVGSFVGDITGALTDGLRSAAGQIKVGETWFGSQSDINAARQAGELSATEYTQASIDLIKSKAGILEINADTTDAEKNVSGFVDRLAAMQQKTEKGEWVSLDDSTLQSAAENVVGMFEEIGDSATSISDPIASAFEAGVISGEEFGEAIEDQADIIKNLGDEAVPALEKISEAFSSGDVEKIKEATDLLDQMNETSTILGDSFDELAGPLQDAFAEGTISAAELNDALNDMASSGARISEELAADLSSIGESMDPTQLDHMWDVIAAGAKEKGPETAAIIADSIEQAGDPAAEGFGDSFLAILSDNLGVGIEDAMKDVDAEGIGEEHGKEYGEAFSEEVAKSYEYSLSNLVAGGKSRGTLSSGELSVGESTYRLEHVYGFSNPWRIYRDDELIKSGEGSDLLQNYLASDPELWKLVDENQLEAARLEAMSSLSEGDLAFYGYTSETILRVATVLRALDGEGEILNPYERWGSPQHIAAKYAEYAREGIEEPLFKSIYNITRNLEEEGKAGMMQAWQTVLDPSATQAEVDAAFDLLLESDVFGGWGRDVGMAYRDGLIDSFDGVYIDFADEMEKIAQEGAAVFSDNFVGEDEAQTMIDRLTWAMTQDPAAFEEAGGRTALQYWEGLQAELDKLDAMITAEADPSQIADQRALIAQIIGDHPYQIQVEAEVNAFGGPLAVGPVDEDGNPITLASLLFGTDAERRKEIEREDLWFKNTVMPLTEDHIDKMLEAATSGYEDDYQAAKANAELLYDLQDEYGQRYLTLRQNQLITALRQGEIGIMAFNEQWDKLNEKQDESKKKVDELSDKYGNLAKTTAESMDDCCDAMSAFGKAQEASSDMFFGSYIGPTENYAAWLAETGEYDKRISVGFDFPDDIDQQVAEYLASHPGEMDVNLKELDKETSDKWLEGLGLSADLEINPPSDEDIFGIVDTIEEADATIVPGAELNQDDLFNIVTEINTTETAIPVGLNADAFWNEYSAIVNAVSNWRIYIPVDVDVVANIPALASQIKAEILAGLQS